MRAARIAFLGLAVIIGFAAACAQTPATEQSASAGAADGQTSAADARPDVKAPPTARTMRMHPAHFIEPIGASPFPVPSLVPGGIAVLEVGDTTSAEPQVTYRGHRAMVIAHNGMWRTVIGIPLAAEPGRDTAEVSVGGETHTLTFEVHPKSYATQRLNVPPKQVDLSKEDLARVDEERPRIDAALEHWRPEVPASLRLAAPVQGPQPRTHGGGLGRL